MTTRSLTEEQAARVLAQYVQECERVKRPLGTSLAELLRLERVQGEQVAALQSRLPVRPVAKDPDL